MKVTLGENTKAVVTPRGMQDIEMKGTLGCAGVDCSHIVSCYECRLGEVEDACMKIEEYKIEWSDDDREFRSRVGL